MVHQSTAIYMRIRHYVFDWLASTKGSVVRLPSNRELARKFGVSQPTVVKALQELIREEYLTMRPGVGLFSNPDRMTESNSKLWGIILGDGRWAYLSREALHVIYQIGDELLKRDRHNLLKVISMGEASDADDNFPELSVLSGICWWLPDDRLLPAMTQIAKRIPVAVIGKKLPDFYSFYSDFEQRNYEIAQRMIARGCKRLVLVLPHYDKEGATRGVRRACSEAGIELPPGCVIEGNPSTCSELERMVDLHCAPDGIICNHGPQDFVSLIAQSKELSRCLIYYDLLWLSDNWSFDGFVGTFDYAKIAPKLADYLVAGVKSAPPKSELLPLTLKETFQTLNNDPRRHKNEKASLHTH